MMINLVSTPSTIINAVLVSLAITAVTTIAAAVPSTHPPAILLRLHHHLMHQHLDATILRPPRGHLHRHTQEATVDDTLNCPGHPFLWKIIDDDSGNHVGFGLGTMHLPHDVVTTPSAYASILSATEDSCNVFGELNPFDGNVTSELAICQSSHPGANVNDIPDSDLRDAIKAKVLEITLAHIESDPDNAQAIASRLFDLPLGEIQNIMLYANTPEYVERYAGSLYSGMGVGSLDTSVLALGKPADDLEEVATRCDLIKELFPTAEQLNQTWDELRPAIVDSLTASLSREIQSYKCGDIDAFIQETSSGALVLDDMADGALLANRNKQMAAKINELLVANPNEKLMFAVENLHWLVGDENLKMLLKNGYGYTLEHIPEWGKDDAEDHTNEHCDVVFDPESGLFVEDPDDDDVPGAAPTVTSIPTHAVVLDTYYMAPTAPTEMGMQIVEESDSPVMAPTTSSTGSGSTTEKADVAAVPVPVSVPVAEVESSSRMIGISNMVFVGVGSFVTHLALYI